ncbi:EAP30/Vps36 family-domain-containing protein [Kockiozyma suomiensis]|uniref:EAP30/Vps36 family-domain-containing protein n=1 Tax=Kockiozyma suomiensis TaxID=1337062 RepID=UPI00334308CC
MSMRRGVGLAAFDNRQRAAQHYSDLGTSILSTHISELSEQLRTFQAALTKFAESHSNEIRSDPVFRSEFVKMCAAIGVDPLASSAANKKSGSFWAELLGNDVNDFFFELAVRIIELCRRTRDENGGLMLVDDVRAYINSLSPNRPPVSHEDIVRAVNSLAPLGHGFEIVKLASKEFIRSVPQEMSKDQAVAIEATQAMGYISIPILRDNLGWETARSITVLDDLVAAGLVWVDDQAKPKEYWTPSWIKQV